jgi:Dolichyl-phosphate-mannose-protein mannosyltransferase
MDNMSSTPTVRASRQSNPEMWKRWTSGPAVVLYISVVTLLVQLLTAHLYGIFRDELYYIACSKHLAWGYVDQPPLIAAITWLERQVGGDSLPSLRFLPAMAGAVTAWLAGVMARRLGGGRFAQELAVLAVLVAPAYLVFFHLLTMNAFEPLIWTASAYVVMRVIQTGNHKLWLWFGLLAGIGLQNKYSMLLFGFGLFIGLLLTPERKAFRQPWIWLAFAAAMLIWLPNLWWNFRHNWPFLELMANVRSSGRDVALSPVAFILQQALFMHPLTAPIWVSGVWWLFFGREGNGRAPYRVLGWTYLVMLVTLIALHGKIYYLAAAYPMLFAAGGVGYERWMNTLRMRWPKPAYVAALIAGGAFMAPVFLPVLPPETFIWYETKFHLVPSLIENQPLGPLQQQLYADMFGWEEMAREVARAYHSMPADIRAKTAIGAGSYGSAGAVDFFGPKYGLPPAISGHQSYWFWGPRNYTGESILLLGERRRRAEELCENPPQVVGHVAHPYSRLDEHFDIYHCRMKWNLQEIWPQAKHFN